MFVDDEENDDCLSIIFDDESKMVMTAAAAQIIGTFEIFLGLLPAFCFFGDESSIAGVGSGGMECCRERSMVDAVFWLTGLNNNALSSAVLLVTYQSDVLLDVGYGCSLLVMYLLARCSNVLFLDMVSFFG